MFVPHSQTVVVPGASPDKWIVVLHGIYGSGGNWRAFAKGLCTASPDWGVVLMDLRMHGKSQGANGPHTLRACAQDGYALIGQCGERGMKVEAVLGHSFGGKVALDMKRLQQEGAHSKALMTWIVDSSPAASPVSLEDDNNVVVDVLKILRSIPRTFSARSEFIAEFTSRGIAAPIAQWLAMNLSPSDSGYRNLLDADVMTSLLDDYYRQDLWDVLAAGGLPTNFAIASKASAIAPPDQHRLDGMRDTHGLAIHHLAGGHWLHVDAAAALIALVAKSLD